MKIPEWAVYLLVWGIGGIGMLLILFYTQLAKNKTPKKSWKSSDYEKELKQDIKKLWNKNNKENKNGMVSK